MANSMVQEMHWFAMRDLKRSNALLPAYKQLTQAGMHVFTPMVTRLYNRNGKQQKCRVPFMQDLLFVHDSRCNLDPIVERIPTLQYRYKRGGAYCEPIVIPDQDMSRFIAATQATDTPRYYTADEMTELMCGRDIRIKGGVLDGLEGKLQTIRGSTTTRLVIVLPTFMAVSVAIHDEIIEIL